MKLMDTKHSLLLQLRILTVEHKHTCCCYGPNHNKQHTSTPGSTTVIRTTFLIGNTKELCRYVIVTGDPGKHGIVGFAGIKTGTASGILSSVQIVGNVAFSILLHDNIVPKNRLFNAEWFVNVPIATGWIQSTGGTGKVLEEFALLVHETFKFGTTARCGGTFLIEKMNRRSRFG